MLTDIFARRYSTVPIWQAFGEAERRLLVQAFRIVSEQLFSYWTADGKERDGARAAWTSIHDRLTMELGLTELSARGYFRTTNLFGNEQSVWQAFVMPVVCQNFVCAQYVQAVAPDTFIKERLSFIEIAFRDKEAAIAQLNADLPARILQAERDALRPASNVIRVPGNPGDGIRAWNRQQNEEFQKAAAELNERFRQAGMRLHYHNGFIQMSDDEQIQQQIEAPFWTLVTDGKWANVDTDIKEAIDRRDTGGRDPAFYAAKALESTIKIISAEKGWTRGGERGAHSFIDNLAATGNGAFISRWEQAALKGFFSDVRNELGHGPGNEPMPELTSQQTDWTDRILYVMDQISY